MNIKTKITLALSFLFAVILLLGGLGAYYLNVVSQEAKEILKDNYETLEYIRNMRLSVSKMPATPENLKEFEKNLILQENNLTEIGEKEVTQQLRIEFEKYKVNPTASSTIGLSLFEIEKLNMQAIIRKNTETLETANRVKNYMIFTAVFCALVTLTFILNFPGYLANPIRQLTEGIREISNQNYEQRLNFKTGDEFEDLSVSFNEMAQKLDAFEHSNLAKIIFEKRRIETIISRMPDAIIGLDEKNTVLFANPVAVNLVGIPEKELVGKNALDVALRNDLLRTLLASSATTEAKNIPLKIFADDRESYFMKETINVINTVSSAKSGNTPPSGVGGLVIILKNITAFHDLDQAKTHFIATISHELKTPISSVKMSLKLLEDERIGTLNEEQKNLIAHIKEDSERLLKITGELLDLSQVETGNIQLNFQSVSPKAIVDFAVQAVRFQAEQKQIFLDIQISENLPAVSADLEKTAWVLVNFLSNAIRYSFEKSKIIVLAKNENPHTIIFSVQDFGKGIDEKYQRRIFERYFQVPAHGEFKTGTGLGLAISKEFIEGQQGKIGVESQVSEGSRFYFTLPVVLP
ncbi:MAG: HAMP domain-containing protein [Verrucomicrobia bacterium]|nr:HAMP domain-containing protein [Cytophagales bacterium]